MFIGEYNYSMDEKRRLAVPAKFRKKLGNSAVITQSVVDFCLVLHPIKEWEKKSEKLQNMPEASGARGIVRLVLSGASDVSFDKLGRILIPEYLKKYAKLKKNITVIGIGNRIEIWSEDNWQEYKEKTAKEIGNIAEKLEELGI